MRLRKISLKPVNRKWFIIYLVSLFAIIALVALFWNPSNSFLKYTGVKVYHPKNDAVNAKGLIGKINAYLSDALNHTDRNAADVFHRYPKLGFAYPLDTERMATYNDVRLVAYTPGTEQEKTFFYNSQFTTLIEQQAGDLSESFFTISFSSDHTSIQSITVDETKLYTVLSNTSWAGTIQLKDPTLDWDSIRKFVICEGHIFPLFSTSDTSAFKNIQVTERDSDFTFENVLAPGSIISAFWDEPHPLSIAIQDDVKFNIYQTGNNITVSAADTTIQIDWNGRLSGHSKTFDKMSKDKNIFFKLKKKGLEIPVTITSKSPYEMGSQVANGAYAGNTIAIDTAYADLYSRQIIRGIRQAFRENDTTRQVTLTYDALQAKYYEDFFRDSLLHTLQANCGKEAGTYYEINLTLVDIATGEIIAAPFYNDLFEKLPQEDLLFKRNYNLKSSYEIGSTFKPILAGSCILNYPSLLNYRFDMSHWNTKDEAEKIYHLDGYDIKWTMKDPKKYFTECDDLADFLARSHDGYPLGLVMNGLIDKKDNSAFNQLLNNSTPPASLVGATTNLIPGKNTLSVRNIQNTNLCRTLDYVFGLNPFKSNKVSNFFPSLKELDQPLELIPEPSSLFGLTEEQILGSHPMNYDKDLRTWILGQGMLDVTLFDLAQAYARLLTKKKINLSYLPQPVSKDLIYSDRMLAEHMAFSHHMNLTEKKPTWDSLLSIWAGAQSRSNATFNIVTPAKGWSNNFAKFNSVISSFPKSSPIHDLQVYFKTGTPSNETARVSYNVIEKNKNLRIGKDDAVFVMAITNKLDSIKTDNTRGIVMIVHVGRRKICKTNAEAATFMHYNGLWGADLLNYFLSPSMVRNILRFNLARFQ